MSQSNDETAALNGDIDDLRYFKEKLERAKSHSSDPAFLKRYEDQVRILEDLPGTK